MWIASPATSKRWKSLQAGNFRRPRPTCSSEGEFPFASQGLLEKLAFVKSIPDEFD